MPVARLRLRIVTAWEREDEEGTRQISESSRGLDLSIGNFGRVLGSRRGGLRLWHKAALLMSPALFTLAKHAIGIAGGLVTMGVVVGAAITPWAGLAFTAASNAEKMGRAGERFRKGTSAVGKAWMKLARDTAPQTLGPVTDFLNGMAAAIPKLEPLVRQVAPDMARMGREMRNWLSGAGFERFLRSIEQYGVPAFRNLVASGRDFLATLGIGFRQFLPLAQDIAETLRRGARDMRAAAQSGAVDRWLRDWRDNSEVANRFLREAAKTIKIVGQLLDDMGPGQLSLINNGLAALNAVNPYTLLAIMLAFAAGKGILGLAAALRMLQAIRALRAVSFLPTAAHLGAAAAALNGAAVAVSGMAAAVSQLAAMVAGLGQRFRVNTGPLDAIKKIWDETPKNATTTLSMPSVDIMVVAMAGVNLTWVTVLDRMAQPATFAPRAETGLAVAVLATMLVAWGGVIASAIATPIFTAFALDTATIGMSAMLVAWARVRAMATLPAVFGVTASPGNVPGVANIITAAWTRVRAQSAIRPRFTATAVGSNVVAGAAAIVAAWMRVVRMPKVWFAVGRVNPGNVPGASRAIFSSWRRMYGLARRWHGVASCNFSGGFSGVRGIGGPVGSGGGGGGGGGGDWRAPGIPGPGFFGGPFPGSDQIFNYDETRIGGLISDIVDFFSNNRPNDPFNPGDFGDSFDPGDFGGGFASGGPIGDLGYGRASSVRTGGGHRSQTVHIYDDVWIRSEEDLVNLILEATK